MKPTPAEIKAARVKAGLTQAEAAKIAGLSAASRFGEYEIGTRSPSDLRWRFFLEAVRKRKHRSPKK